jgi:hypothetical protein
MNDIEPLTRLLTTAGAIESLRDLFAAEEPLDSQHRFPCDGS